MDSISISLKEENNNSWLRNKFMINTKPVCGPVLLFSPVIYLLKCIHLNFYIYHNYTFSLLNKTLTSTVESYRSDCKILIQ